MNRNSKAICGTNTTTLPTPAITPSVTRSVNSPGPSTRAAASDKCPTPVSIQPITGSAQLKID